MSQEVKRHGIFVASTTDLTEERQAAIESIMQWNTDNWDAGLVFIPLLWELGTVADAKVTRAQDAINKQLFTKASCLIGIFKYRLGAGGTSEEIRKAIDHKDFPTALYFSNEDVPKPLTKESLRLDKWKKQHAPGLYTEYDNIDQMKSRIQSLLQNWSKKLPRHKRPTGLIEETLRAADYLEWLHTWNPSNSPCTLLLYNVELESFRTEEKFTEIWSLLAEEKFLKKVVLLLPSYKLRRLKDYMEKWANQDILERLRDWFFCCPVSLSPSESHPITSSTAFCLLRSGATPESGNSLHGARLFILSEPFSRPEKKDRLPEVVWRYKHTFITEDDEILQSLTDVWDNAYSSNEQIPLVDVLENKISPASKSAIKIDTKRAPSSGADALSTIKLLRYRLFEPNVPSYLLDPNYFILDWNPAFEMIFPTTCFYRHEHVKEFVTHFNNRDQAFRRGEVFERGDIKDWFDMEQLSYQSSKYGVIELSKMASRVNDPITQGVIGWIVALHVNRVEDFDAYEDDLKIINEENSLYSMYAKPYQRIIQQFPPYLDLIQRHAQALSTCENVLDAGCGPGALASELLKTAKSVTSVDDNDRMLEVARATFDQFPEDKKSGLSLVKANMGTLHRPNVDYLASVTGIRSNYDGIALMNSYHTLSNPEETLTRIRTELLDKGAVLAMSLPSKNTDIDTLLTAIRDYGNELQDKNGIIPWNAAEWEIFTRVNRQLHSTGRLARNSQNFEQVLKNSGFEIERSEDCYVGQGIFVVARAS